MDGIETLGIIESFVDHDDAFLFLNTQLIEHASEGWNTVQGSGMNYVNHQWRVGLQFERERR